MKELEYTHHEDVALQHLIDEENHIVLFQWYILFQFASDILDNVYELLFH